MPLKTADNNFGTAKWIVSAAYSDGCTHTTIASALTSASSGDTIFIRPGTYTENLTLKAGVNLTAYPCDAYAGLGTSPNVIILGKATATFAGNCSISGIQLKTNSDFCLAVTGSSATKIQLKGCYIDASNNTAISFTSSSNTSAIEIYDCRGNLETTGIAYFAHSGAGRLYIVGGIFENNGGSSTASTNSSSTAGGASWFGVSYWNNSYTATNTGQTTASNSGLIGAFTVIGSTDSMVNCSIASATASAVSVSVGGTLILCNCVIDSTNTNAITGAGSLKFAELSFSNTSSTINTTTQIPLVESNGAIKVVTPGAYPYTTISQDGIILVDSSSARTITPLASPTTGQKHIIKDSVGSAAANNITITPSGKNVDGAASAVININYGSATIIYNGTEWNLI